MVSENTRRGARNWCPKLISLFSRLNKVVSEINTTICCYRFKFGLPLGVPVSGAISVTTDLDEDLGVPVSGAISVTPCLVTKPLILSGSWGGCSLAPLVW